MHVPRLFDVIGFLLTAGLILALSLHAYGEAGGGEAKVHIQSVHKEWYYPLDTHEQVSVPGPLGKTEVLIDHGSVRVLSSPCSAKICITTGAIRDPNGWIACMPNQVFIEIIGTHSEEADATAF
jgi:hypothetical protein